MAKDYEKFLKESIGGGHKKSKKTSRAEEGEKTKGAE